MIHINPHTGKELKDKDVLKVTMKGRFIRTPKTEAERIRDKDLKRPSNDKYFYEVIAKTYKGRKEHFEVGVKFPSFAEASKAKLKIDLMLADKKKQLIETFLSDGSR
jgi:hypothetical protein